MFSAGRAYSLGGSAPPYLRVFLCSICLCAGQPARHCSANFIAKWCWCVHGGRSRSGRALCRECAEKRAWVGVSARYTKRIMAAFIAKQFSLFSPCSMTAAHTAPAAVRTRALILGSLGLCASLAHCIGRAALYAPTLTSLSRAILEALLIGGEGERGGGGSRDHPLVG